MYKSLRQQTLHYLARPQAGIRRQPIRGAAAWTSAELRGDSSWVYHFSDADITEFDAAIVHARASAKTSGQLLRGDFPLPKLQHAIDAWRTDIRSGRGFVLLRGLPVSRWSTADCELAFWGLGLHLGIPGAQNPQADLLGHVRNEGLNEDVRYYRTNRSLAMHCDAADVVGLLCLQGAASGGLSRIVSSATLYNHVLATEPQLIDWLYRPFWFDTKGEGGINAFPIAPCAHADDELRTFWQSDYFRSAGRHPQVPPLQAEQQRLLDIYDEVSARPGVHLDMDLAPGDIQLLSNHSVLHGRTAFEDHADPARRRHLLRLWISLPGPTRWPSRLRRMRSHLGLAGTALGQLLRSHAVRTHTS